MRYLKLSLLLTTAAALPLAGCTSTANTDSPAAAPAMVVEPTGTSGINRITLTERAVERLDIHLAAVVANGKNVQLPYSALLYDASGAEWVYVSAKAGVFERANVKVERISGDTMVLSRGPAAGTRVVIVGAAELFGVESEIEED